MPALLPKNREHGWAPYVWLVFLAFFLWGPIVNHADSREWTITIVATLAFLIMYFGIFWSKPPLSYILVAGMVAEGLTLANHNPGSSVFIILGSSFIPWIFRTIARSFIALLALIAVIVVHAMVFHTPSGFCTAPLPPFLALKSMKASTRSWAWPRMARLVMSIKYGS